MLVISDVSQVLDFYPRPPRGGRHYAELTGMLAEKFLSTPSARRATLESDFQPVTGMEFLSTPSARRATQQPAHSRNVAKISIHALREEGDESGHPDQRHNCNFYPRPPRGGRPERKCPHHSGCPISIHALREEGDPALMGMHPTQTISIHALREEGDMGIDIIKNWRKEFLSTPSARRATRKPRRTSNPQKDFYPRPPRGGRRKRGNQ